MGETKIRAIRIDDALWEAAQAEAVARRETVSTAVRRLLLEYAGHRLTDDT